MLLLAVLGLSFNIMTLGGIAAAVGLLIDDVIVMVEHIARRAGATVDDKVAGASAVLPAALEFMRPLTGSSLATLIVFLPLSFLARRDRRIFARAVDHDGRGAGYLLPDDGLRCAGAGAALDRFRHVARPGASRPRLAGARAMRGAVDGLFRRPWLWARC